MYYISIHAIDGRVAVFDLVRCVDCHTKRKLHCKNLFFDAKVAEFTKRRKRKKIFLFSLENIT